MVVHIQAVSAAQGWDYLLKQVMHGVDDYYRAEEVAGEAPGRWVGDSDALLGLAGVVSTEQFRALYEEHRDPASLETLGRTRRVYKGVTERLEAQRGELAAAGVVLGPEELAGLERQIRRTDRISVDAFDATFSPVKSVSVLWAALDDEGRAEVLAAHHEAVASGVDMLRREGAYTRTGHHGGRAGSSRTGRFEDSDGLIASAWDHRMSRAGDPQLHTHVVLLNQTRTSSDGGWRTLDSKALHRAKDLAGAAYEQVLMHELTRRLGVGWELRSDRKAFEIEGVGERVRRQFSSRRVAIDARLQPLVTAHLQAYGREPTAYELSRMSEWATLQARPRKGQAESTRDALARWRAEFTASTQRTLDGLADSVLGRNRAEPAAEPAGAEKQAAELALERIGSKRTVWDRSDLAREVGFALGAHVDPSLDPAGVVARIDRVTDQVLAGPAVMALAAPDLLELPDELRRANGESVYVAPHSTKYATAAQLAHEDFLLGSAQERTAHVVAGEQVLARLQQPGAQGVPAGRELSAEQQDAVVALLGSGARVQAMVGPAGAGKTTVLGAVSRVWQAETSGRVVALAPSQIAAQVLARELADAPGLAGIGAPAVAMNTARWALRASNNPDRWGVRPGDLVLLDEAGMVSDTHLRFVLEAVRAADARLLVVGDPAQLPSPEAGAGYALLAAQPSAVRLTEVRRFTETWEAEASLRLRDGDPAGLDAYDRRGRLHTGVREQLEEAAWQAWSADTALGRSSLLILATNDDVTAANGRARAERVTLGQVDDTRSLALRDGTRAGVGDRIVTRQNDTEEAGGQAVNRAIWTVTRVDDDGLQVAPDDPGERAGLTAPVTLSGRYVAAHVELAYARTAHGTQGMTVDTSHTLVAIDGTDRAGVYVPITRGREENHLYIETLVLGGDGQPVRHEQGLAVLARSLERDSTQTSARDTWAEELSAAESIPALAIVLEDITARFDASRHRALLERALPAEAAARLRGDSAEAGLLRAVREIAMCGQDAEMLVDLAARERGFSGSESVGQVMLWRLGRLTRRLTEVGEGAGGPAEWTGWQSFVPVADQVDERQESLRQVAERAAIALDERTAALGQQVADEQPGWAVAAFGNVPGDAAERVRWIERVGLVAAWRECADIRTDAAADGTVLGPVPVGPQPLARALWSAAHQGLGELEESKDWRSTPSEELHRIARIGQVTRGMGPGFQDGPLWAAHQEVRRARTALGLARHELASNEHRVRQANGPHGTRWLRRGGLAAVTAECDRQRDDVAELGRRLESREAWLRVVERKAERRDGWYAQHRPGLDEGQRAERELARRARLAAPGGAASSVAGDGPSPDDGTTLAGRRQLYDSNRQQRGQRRSPHL